MLTHLSKQWKTELTDLVRGASGGFLLGIPLLYTMEVWWIGSYVSPFRMLFALVLTFLIVLLLNQASGFRHGNDIRTINAVKDTIKALAIGLVCSGATLVLLREIRFDAPLIEVLGKLIYESVPFTFGVALANQFLGKDESRSGDDPPARQGNATLSDISATLIGALVIAFNIAPTDEIPMLASAVTGGWLLAMIAASLLVSYCIVFAAGFTNQSQRYQHKGVFQRPWGETIAAYLVSLFAAMLMLVFFQKLHFDDPWQLWLRYTVLLGLPAAVGGAAGRLAA
ncbi:TIGR02587 family membrane protein [Cyanobacteria bacterium FACHB-DQ100]|uniref:TIGR02587 family membrane protein n=1 Tax=Leptolyngbya sp. DQ-M1 TaxID=2933920 RepID=UPI0019881A38|nr:TIGR02587 family membrane protein [Cyanobacteria bacterium FACHB-DQ100]